MKPMNREMQVKPKSLYGLAGIELLAIVAVLMLALTVALPLFLHNKPSDRLDITRQRMAAVKNAIMGDPQTLHERSRTSFGFVGDLGVLPANLDELITQSPSRPGYQVFNYVWFGWRGPYVTSDTTQKGTVNGDIYTVLHDAWGNPLNYTTDAMQFPTGAPPGSVALIRSSGPDGTFDPLNLIADDILLYIFEDEIKTYVSGYFKDRQGNPVQESLVTVYFPNGTPALDSVQITPNPDNPILYNSQTDTISAVNKRKIPIGSRFFQTRDLDLKKLSVLNGGPLAHIDFISPQEVEPPAILEELTFRPTDQTDYQSEFSPVYIPTGGKWEPIGMTEQSASSGYLTFSGNSQGWTDDTHIVSFGNSRWDDYRIEANILHGNGHKYQVLYRMSGLGYNPGQLDDNLKVMGTGYGFEFDPQSSFNDDYAWGENNGYNGPGIGRVILRIWKYRNGLPRLLMAEKEYNKAAFEAAFGYPILWRPHQLSITVKNNGGNIEQYILINGVQVFDSDIVDYAPTGIPASGYAGILVHMHTNFRLYHLLVHQIPPQPEFPVVWWSFEEGEYRDILNRHTYGFGYLDHSSLLRGLIIDPTSVRRVWLDGSIHGQCFSLPGQNNGRIEFGNIFNFHTSDIFSISAWVRINNAPSGPASPYIVMSKRKAEGNNHRGWSLVLENHGPYSARVAFSLNVKEGNQGGGQGGGQGNQPRELRIANIQTPITMGKWYHLVVTYNGSGLHGNTPVPPSALSIYVTDADDNEVETSPTLDIVSDTLRANDNISNGGDFIIGTQENGELPFRGFIDEVKVFYRVLTPEEIDALFKKR